MSEHTKGLAKVESRAVIVGDVVISVSGRAENARRIAAAWNALEYLSTDQIEASTASRDEELNAARAMIQQQDALLGKKACATKECRELLAARALLREVVSWTRPSVELTDRIESYLDACDTLEGK